MTHNAFERFSSSKRNWSLGLVDGKTHITPDGDSMTHILSMDCECQPRAFDNTVMHYAKDGKR